MAKHYKEETGKSDAYSLIGEVVRYYKQRTINIWVTILSIIAVLLILISIALFFEVDGITAPVVVLVIGIVFLVIVIIISAVSSSRKKKQDLAAIGKEKFDKDIGPIEEEVTKINAKKRGNKDIFKDMEKTDKLVYLSKHLTDVEFAIVPVKDARVYNITLDDGSSMPITVCYTIYYEEFILDIYLMTRFKQKHNSK